MQDEVEIVTRSGLFRVIDAAGGDNVCRFLLSAVCIILSADGSIGSDNDELTGRVYNLGDAFFGSALAEEDTGCGGVSEDVTTNRFSTINTHTESSARIALNLVGHKDADIELCVWLAKAVKVRVEMDVVYPQQSASAVGDTG